MTLLFPCGFLLAGLLVSDMPMTDAIIIGGGLGFIALIITLFSLRGGKKPPWEGVVTEKYYQDRHERSGDSSTTYTEFVTVIRADNGKKNSIVEKTRNMYDYLIVGDRVRYYPVFGTYEKYNKSGDSLIYCNVCGMMNPIRNDRCKRCHNLLFK